MAKRRVPTFWQSVRERIYGQQVPTTPLGGNGGWIQRDIIGEIERERDKGGKREEFVTAIKPGD